MFATHDEKSIPMTVSAEDILALCMTAAELCGEFRQSLTAGAKSAHDRERVAAAVRETAIDLFTLSEELVGTSAAPIEPPVETPVEPPIEQPIELSVETPIEPLVAVPEKPARPTPREQALAARAKMIAEAAAIRDDSTMATTN